MNIKKLSIVLLAGIATLVTATEPSLAQRRNSANSAGYDAYASASTDRSGAYYYGPGAARAEAPATFRAAPLRSEPLTPSQQFYNRYNYGQNLPYADRPYGDPDSW